MKKKIALIIVLTVIAIFSVLVGSFSEAEESNYQMPFLKTEATGNFFTQPADTSPVEIIDRRPELETAGYEPMAATDKLELYCLKPTLGIAVYDRRSGYTWYSSYPKIAGLPNPPTGVVASRIASGVTIEYYDGNGAVITAATLSLTENAAKAKTVYRSLDNGFIAEIDFTAVGIKFNVVVTIVDNALRVVIPDESIVEYEVDRLMRLLNFQLKSIMLFPYFGSENYEINGYAMIPDGSGALIRYTDIPSATGFIKRIYGPDYGMATSTSTNLHLKPTPAVGLPIYGVAHGYNQAAFLAEIISGAGAAEIHSYPYLYNNIPINTTFFKLITRDTFRLEISSGEAITLLNSAPYPYDYALEYRFLQNQAANYVGMAQAYRESLGLSPQAPAAQRVPLRLIMLGVDYKPGLFGKKYQTMTDFSQALAIIKSLENNDVEDFQITYLGWNRGGYYNNRSSGRKISRQLGAIDLLNDYIKEKKYKIDYTVNPLISDRYGFGAKTIKKINLSPFKIEQKSSLVNTAYYLAPSTLAAAIKSNGKYYHKKQIEAFNIDNLAAAFSYRYQNEVFYREMMTSLIPEELEQLTDFTLSTANPHDYLLAYLCNYYNAPYQSNKYIYVTDSVPFLSLLLSGFINLYAPEVNYLSDYYLAALRMIEYNLYPSFIITSSEAHHLRYTNFEYLLSTEYRLWENLIIEIYKTVNEALGRVRGQRMVEHGYPVCGVAQVVYDDGTVILINYNDVDYSSPYGLVKAGSYLVSGGDKS